MTRWYIAGPMTGHVDHNFPAFHAEAARLRALGYEVVSPAEINAMKPATWEEALRADIAGLLTCDGIAKLSGWQLSRGAQLEVHIARALGMREALAWDIQERAEVSA